MCLWSRYKKKYEFLLASLMSLKKGVGSGFRSVSQSYGSADPGPHQNFTDPKHWLLYIKVCRARKKQGSRLGTFQVKALQVPAPNLLLYVKFDDL